MNVRDREMGSEDARERPASSADEGALRESGRALVYLAAERTLLTWIRAAIAFLVLGFAVDRFGMMAARNAAGGLRGLPGSSWVGIALVATGIAAAVVSAFRYRRFNRRFARGEIHPGSGLPLAIALAYLLALIGSGVALLLWLSAG